MEVLDNFAEVLRSNCVTIYAGGGRKLAVHEAVLSKSGSPSLQKLVEPHWRESSEGSIDWKHTSSPTVDRVLTWLYFRDYQSPNPVPRKVGTQPDQPSSERNGLKGEDNSQQLAQRNEVVDPELEAEVMVQELGTPTWPPAEVVTEVLEPEPALEPSHSEADDPNLQDAILESCHLRPLTPLGRCAGVPPAIAAYKTAAGVFEDQEFPHKTFSYWEPLLAHVEVYSFAKYHLLPGLQELALQRTTITLRKLDCSVELAEQELTKIIEFVYDKIPADSNSEEPMRKLLCQYAAMNYTSLLHGSFEALVTRGGDFTLDLARKLSRRLLAHGVSAELVEDELAGRIQSLEHQVQERDREIKSLNASLNDTSTWGRGLTKKGRRR
ncbi:hypothetical protein PV04_09119 [Phialophora macrospora]|uniref:BTB domain-containing protein n=1 Tax=Phialophora macrospora TaxID=1851006 RepID=A0A0D2CG77_9EURO|nr:hypothetical protein PV04_09119 [Phialophora macrospora]